MNQCGTCRAQLDYEGAGDDCDVCKTAKLRAELEDWKRRALAAEARAETIFRSANATFVCPCGRISTLTTEVAK